jgi:hypothetical protein
MDSKNLWEKMIRYGLRSRAAGAEAPPEAPLPPPAREGG